MGTVVAVKGVSPTKRISRAPVTDSTTVTASYLVVTGQLVAEIVCGEPFTVEEGVGEVFLTHPQWSLLGVGPTREAARADLLASARELAVSMSNDDPASLSPEAVRLREFALRV